MTQEQKETVRYMLNGIAITCMIIVISVGIAFVISTIARPGELESNSPSELECNECGCTTKPDQFKIRGNIL